MPADRIPELIPLLVEITRPGEALRTYRCRECGQLWQQHDVDGEALVVQVGWATRPRPGPPPPVARPRLTPNAPPPPLRWRRRGGLVAFVLLAGVFFAISTLPPFVTGPLARGAWLARWIVGGLLLILAVQTLVDLARRARRKA